MTSSSPFKQGIALSESELLAQSPIRQVVSQLFDLSGLPQSHFQTFYMEPLGRFLALTQHSPAEKQHTHLFTVIKALKMRRTLILPLGADAESISKQKDLWTYAVFVGALMFNTAELFSGKVLYRKKEETKPCEWSPFDGAVLKGSQYRLVDTQSTSPLIVASLLPYIFCKQGLSWLYSQVNVFNVALELAVSPQTVARIGELVTGAHNLDSAPQKPELLEVHDSCDGDSDETPVSKVPSFREWLKAAIDAGRYRDHIVETVNGHAIAEPDIFHLYCKETGATEPEKQREQFLRLGIHQGGQRVRFGSGATKKAFFIFSNAEF